MHEEESAQQKAIRLLKRQLEELQTIRSLNHKDPAFTAWRDTTRSVLERLLGPEEHHSKRFHGLRFSGPMRVIPFGGRVPPPGYISREDAEAFQTACDTSDATIRAAIRHIEDFGLYVEQARPAGRGRGGGRSGGVSQSFHGPVQLNQAIAADSATQRIGHIGNKVGSDLKQIAELLAQSEDLTPRQVRQGRDDIEALAVEVEKPEGKRNWNAVLDLGSKVLELAGKATDVGHKLTSHLPTVVALIESARHYIK